MTSTDERTALIVGAGIAGMSTAIALRRIGVPVDLVEIQPQWRVAGAGITLTGPTLRAFDALGVYNEVASRGYVGEGIRVCNVAGEFVRDLATPMPAGARVAGSGGITRPVLHDILSARTVAAGTRIRTGVSVRSLTQDSTGVDVAFSDGSTGRYDFVIGADGVNSQIREMIFADPPRPEYNGQSVWRTFVPRPEHVDRRHYFLGGPAKVGFTPVSNHEMYLFAVPRTPRAGRRSRSDTGRVRRNCAAAPRVVDAAVEDCVPPAGGVRAAHSLA
jgi:2-polyprenyl-6-methoxyphenol hydroxylase-like FAD-dependent oxidoreductase